MVQRSCFIDKFGREPGPQDPLFFDENSDSPQAAPESQRDSRWEELVQLIEASGAPPEVLHAMHRTERIITSPRWFVVPGMPTNEHHMTPEEIKEWEDAMQEWHDWQARASKAESEGEHPAFVEAIRRTGLRLPRDEEYTLKTGGVSASGDSAVWFKFINEYMLEHPEHADIVTQRMRTLFEKTASPS